MQRRDLLQSSVTVTAIAIMGSALGAAAQASIAIRDDEASRRDHVQDGRICLATDLLPAGTRWVDYIIWKDIASAEASVEVPGARARAATVKITPRAAVGQPSPARS